MIREVAVETNWVLDVALQQDAASEELFKYAREGRIQLFLPSFSVAEAVKALEAKEQRWRDLSTELEKTKREFGRSELSKPLVGDLDPAISALASVQDTVETRFWVTLEDIGRVARIVEPTPETIKLTAQIRDFLKLSPADAAVLATVVSLKSAGVCTTFMSRDKEAFASESTRTYMGTEGVTYYDSASPIVGPLRAADAS